MLARMREVIPKQEDRAVALLIDRGMARLSEFIAEGITAATISRMERIGAVIQLARGLYQLPNAPIEAHHALAEAAKLIPNGVVCLSSALAFHDLSDQISPFVWMAIGPKVWRPKVTRPRIQIMRYGPKHIRQGHRGARHRERDRAHLFAGQDHR